jgi:hypothetical protein
MRCKDWLRMFIYPQAGELESCPIIHGQRAFEMRFFSLPYSLYSPTTRKDKKHHLLSVKRMTTSRETFAAKRKSALSRMVCVSQTITRIRLVDSCETSVSILHIIWCRQVQTRVSTYAGRIERTLKGFEIQAAAWCTVGYTYNTVVAHHKRCDIPDRNRFVHRIHIRSEFTLYGTFIQYMLLNLRWWTWMISDYIQYSTVQCVTCAFARERV